MKLTSQLPIWSIISPVVAWVLLILFKLGYGAGSGGLMEALLVAGLMAGIFAAVFHAEVVAHRVGEPYGTLSCLGHTGGGLCADFGVAQLHDNDFGSNL
jgi:Ca2+:H+ antiporter